MEPIGLVFMVGVVVMGILFLLAGSRATSGRGDGSSGSGWFFGGDGGSSHNGGWGDAGDGVVAGMGAVAVAATNRS
jgi:hypothetical protein